ncbi:MAG: hypothetical protein WB421_12825 [Terriglobales bacterium]
MASLTTLQTLAELVQRYQICWEVWPEFTLTKQDRQQVGFELELFGSGKRTGEFDATCPKSAEIHAALEAIARWILESDERVSFEVNDDRQCLSYSPARGNRPDVTMSVKILHRTDLDRPVDEGERDCLRKTEARLRQLGACEHHWHFASAGNDGELVAD